MPSQMTVQYISKTFPDGCKEIAPIDISVVKGNLRCEGSTCFSYVFGESQSFIPDESSLKYYIKIEKGSKKTDYVKSLGCRVMNSSTICSNRLLLQNPFYYIQCKYTSGNVETTLILSSKQRDNLDQLWIIQGPGRKLENAGEALDSREKQYKKVRIY